MSKPFSTDNEMKVHDWFKKQLLKRYDNIYIHKPQGGVYGRKGAHDFIFCIKGRFFSVEVKMPGNTMTETQKVTYRNVITAGGFSSVLVGRDEDIFREIDSWLKG